MTTNDATITFGSQIQVVFGGASQSFATCTEMDAAGAVCM
jgi:hypothetical protein